MISLITCSRSHDISQTLRENISETIGSEYELIVVDNNDNHHSIFSSYNEGVNLAKGDILCFMHDDILYRTPNWGLMVEQLLQDSSEIDACATVGSSYVRKTPTLTGNYPYIAHYWEQGGKGVFNTFGDRVTPIATFDGMWFCIRRQCFDTIRFDDINYHGFHFYDMDIGMQLFRAGFHTVFIPNLLIYHSSGGNTGAEWLENGFVFYRKWHDILPVYVGKILPPPTKKEIIELEKKALYTLLRLIVRYRRFGLMGSWLDCAHSALGKSAWLCPAIVILHHIKLRK